MPSRWLARPLESGLDRKNAGTSFLQRTERVVCSVTKSCLLMSITYLLGSCAVIKVVDLLAMGNSFTLSNARDPVDVLLYSENRKSDPTTEIDQWRTSGWNRTHGLLDYFIHSPAGLLSVLIYKLRVQYADK